MAVTRIVTNIAIAPFDAARIDAARAFYGTILGMTVAMDHGWIVTFVGDGAATPQISFAAEGGSGTPVPDLSIEVDDLTDVQRRLFKAGYPIEYGPADEPWGVRRFFVRDPFGRLLNILSHI
ncbi:glyoxalase [Rhodopseudomonas sp. AAP120]|uniref:VOC family protein n=1 Tax=Rhodopseudomonas sp. AAP120 TaxID=1523430 RepID=UPI0006B97B13|nr:VOC family protein [Rhodopseudomonas sp. AAP120]KPG02125.1 glyoxalase [Rhodopseudomonas sp. AAP120]